MEFDVAPQKIIRWSMHNMLKAAILDYEICNMFSVQRAAEYAGFECVVTHDYHDLKGADLVILPGVGAFPDAMEALHRLDLVEPLREFAHSGKMMVGICLGFQMLFTESDEFGHTNGLNLIPGKVKRFENIGDNASLKIPHIGWNQVYSPSVDDAGKTVAKHWQQSPLKSVENHDYFYFVHSYYAMPNDPSVVLAKTRYGSYDFTSAVRWNNIYAFQFHPERSGQSGIEIYRGMKELITNYQNPCIER